MSMQLRAESNRRLWNEMDGSGFMVVPNKGESCVSQARYRWILATSRITLEKDKSESATILLSSGTEEDLYNASIRAVGMISENLSMASLSPRSCCVTL